MKISGRVDGSVCGAVLSNGSPATLRRATTAGAGRRPFCTAKVSQTPRQSSKRPLGSSFFCSQTSLWLSSTFLPGAESRPTIPPPPKNRYRDVSHTYSTTAAAAPATGTTATAKPSSQFATQSVVRDKQTLLSYVPSEEDATADEYFGFYRDPYRRGYAQPDGPNLQVSESKHDVEYPVKEEVFTADDEMKRLVGKLCHAITLKLRHPHRATLGSIYRLYKRLPEPRMLNLTGQWRHRLLKIMGNPRKRDMESMMRYFALVADVRNAGLTIRRSQWNYAMTFATKFTAWMSGQEMETALRLWREMEREAKIPGNDVTFNVLFDVASKAGNFALADMIYSEMDKRGIEFNRFHHVSLIYFFGLKLDSGGIRAAYKEMVESGEMIDTVVLNCVISGLLRCGEEAAAEETYQRMKNGNTPAVDMPGRDYMMGKVVTKVLMMFSKIGKEHPQLKKSFETNVQLAPDIRTYRLLVDHYAIKLGDLGKVAQYLDEMRFLKIAIHPTIFLALFKGFYVHGGFPGSEWSESRLQGVLSALYDARDGHARGFKIDRWVVIWALRAVRKCSTSEAVVQTYDEMERRWDIPEERHPFMASLLDNIVHDKDLKAQTHNKHASLHRSYESEPVARKGTGAGDPKLISDTCNKST